MPKSVLIVDDEKLIVWSLIERFKQEGFITYSADCGEAAIRILQSEAIDLIITDVRMPGLDGFEVLRYAKQLKPGPTVIMMSAHGSPTDRKKAATNGAATFFDKPVHVEKLIDVTSVLGSVGN
jgi:DNA-binding NtrC family response regulator